MYGRLKGDNMNKQEIIDSSLFGVEITINFSFVHRSS